jgi:hypothetical protein
VVWGGAFGVQQGVTAAARLGLMVLPLCILAVRAAGALLAHDGFLRLLSLPPQAFHCKVCRYTAERRHPACAAHPRAVEKVEVSAAGCLCA